MFSQVVALYRALGCPSFAGEVFSYRGPADDDVLRLIRACEELPPRVGGFNYVETDEPGNVELEFKPSRNEYGRFHTDWEAFVNESRSSLSGGKLPNNYYIVSDDYWSGDLDSTMQPCAAIWLSKIQSCAELVRGLLGLADNSVPSGDGFKLFFALPAGVDQPPRTLGLSTTVSLEVLDCYLPHIHLLKALNEASSDRLHVEERRSILRMAIADVLQQEGGVREGSILHVAKNWPLILKKYRHDLTSYVNGFSFEKIRRDIAAAEVEYASKLSSLLGDVTGKLFGIPVSVAALIALVQTRGGVESLLIVVGLIIASLIFSGTLNNFRLLAVRVMHGFNTVISQFETAEAPMVLHNMLVEAGCGVREQKRLLDRSIVVFYLLAWLPTLLAVLMYGYRFNDAVRLVVNRVGERVLILVNGAF